MNPRWRSVGRGLPTEVWLVREGTDSPFPYIMLTVQNVLAVKYLPCVSCKYKIEKHEYMHRSQYPVPEIFFLFSATDAKKPLWRSKMAGKIRLLAS